MNKKMKSKSFDLKPSSNERGKNKSFDFVGLYKSAAESNSILTGKPKQAEGQKNDSKLINATPKRERSPNKNQKKRFKNEAIEISQINIDGSNLNSSLGINTPLMGTKVTSTPNPSAKSKSQSRVKSIMKNKSENGDVSMEGSQLDVSSASSTKPKKRNKSVSFMLDDNEEVVIKKTKSNDSLIVSKENKVSPEVKIKHKDESINKKKIKNYQQSEKENKASHVNNIMETDVTSANQTIKKKDQINKKKKLLGDAGDTADSQSPNLDKKKKFKKEKKQKKVDSSEPTKNETTEGSQEVKNKKTKKKKRQAKTQTDATETEGEPATKSRKKDVKPELIAEDLENLSIGDNAHTLTNLLDEMMVVDKVKRKRLRQKLNKAKKQKTTNETGDMEKAKGEKEKQKWKKRKWNKDKKGDVNEDLATTVIVEGLPLSIMLNYKALLTEYFAKLGLIKKIGIAEVYPTEESRPVFTTTITFNSDGAAQLALDEDKSTFEGSRIRVKRPLPPTETTIVLRTYGDITPQVVGALFTGAGKIRNIRHLVKGKKAMSSVFIEFDGPKSVERAIKMAEDAKIGGKKIHVCKFEIRKSKQEKETKTSTENEGDESDNSNE